MNKIIFDIQRFTEDNSGDTTSDALELMHSIIQRFDLKTVDDTKLQGGSSTLNSTLKFIGTFWGSLFFKKSTRTTEVNALTTMLAGTVSIVEDIYAIREEKNKNNPSEVLITAKAEDLISNLTSLTNAFQKLSSGKNSFILSIVSSVVGLAANLVLSMDGLKEDEIEKINKSYVSLLQVSSAEIIKKFFSEGLADNLIKMPVNQILDNPAVKAEIRKQTATNFTKGSGPLGLIFAAITGVLNAANEYDSRVKKYTEDGIPEDITKHDARIDAIATFVHDTASYYAKGFDDTVFKWIQAGLSFIRGEDIPYYTDKNYVEVITDWFKTLNYENSGTSGDDKFYVLENKSMVYGDSGNDDIGNYGFSNVTIWGGHDDDTLGSYKTDSATPQNNSIFGGPGNDQISVYDKDSTIYGGTGKDFINVVGTNNEIFGDADDDKFYIANGANNNTLSGDNGDDFIVMLEEAKNTMIKYASGDGSDTIYGFNEDDSLKISGSYKTTVDGNHLKITVSEGSILLVDMAGKNININGKTIKSGEENSTVEPVPPPEFPTLPATVASPFIYGTEGADTIKNSLDNVVIEALDGNDTITNGYYDDDYIWHSSGSRVSINGGSGNDSISNRGIDNGGISSFIDGGSGNDKIFNDASNVIITAGDGDDTVSNYNYASMTAINADDGNDYIDNGNSYVTINTANGNDTIFNYSSSVTINASNGDDSIYSRGSSYSTIDGGTGKDSIYNEGGSDITIDAGDGNDSVHNDSGYAISISTGDGNDSIYNEYHFVWNSKKMYWEDTRNHPDSSTLEGGAGDDYIRNGNSIPSGINIESVLNLGGDNVIIKGNEGNDSIYNNGISATINGGVGDDSIDNHGYYVTINGDAGDDSIENCAHSATIDAGDGNDTIDNYSDAVTIAAGTGNDYIYNYDENLLIKYSSGDGNDLITGFNAMSTLRISEGSYYTIKSGDDIIVTVGEGKITLVGAASLSTVHIEGVEDSSSDSKLITLTAGNDNYSNTVEGATINALDGDDTILNEGGASVSVNGGAGNDEIHNRNDFVKINGGDGDDRIWNEVSGTLSGGASVYVNAGTGNDTLYNDGDDSTLIGGNGEDYIENWNANVSIDAGASNDIIINNSSGNNSTIFGGAGSDYIDNRYAKNVLFKYKSGDGNDIIDGFNIDSTLSICGSSYSTKKSGNDIIVTVKDGKISLMGAASLDAVNIDGEEENLTNLTFNNKTDSNVTLPAQTETVDASERTKPIKITGNTLANSLFGGKGNDTLDGTEGNNTLTGGKGNDIFIYNGGNDIITDYQKGKDKISLDSASISNFTTTNKDVIFVLSNNNSLTLNNMAYKQISFLSGSKTTKIAFTNNASLDGSEKGATLIPAITEFSAVNYSKLVTINAENVSFTVNIIGNNKANRIIAGNHGSILNGGKGKDSLIGGNGSDIFIYENKSGNKIIQNYTSSDAISLVGAQISDIYTKNKDVVLKTGSKKITVKDAANQEITINENGTTKFFIDNILYDEEKTSATLSSKFFAKDEKIFDSTISYINASNAKKKLNIVASATDGATIKSGKGKDTLISGIGNDSISGGKGKDILRGGAGADSLWGGKGNDTLYGGEDDDTFVFYAGEGNDVIADYASGDMLQIMNKKGNGYADFKKATFKDETLTLNINGGGKLILSGVNGDAFVNINGENNKISSLLK